MRVSLVSDDASPLAILGETEASGRHAYIAGLAGALADRGHDVVVYTRRDAWQLPSQCELFPGVQVKHVTAGPTRPATDDERSRCVPAFGRQIVRAWTSLGRPDIVHAHSWRSGAAAMFANRATGVPVVQTFHELSDGSDRHPPEQAPTESDSIRRVDHMLTTRSSVQADLTRLGAPADQVTTIAGGVDTGLFSPTGPGWEVGEYRRLVCLGGPTPHNGLDTVLDAMTRLPDTELLLAGGPPSSAMGMSDEAQRLTELATEYGLGGRFQLIGTIKHEDVPALLRSAAAVVSTPERAPYALAPLEAMSCGRPVICTAVGGSFEAVDDGSTGLFVNPGDPAELATAIRGVLDDEALAKRLGEQGRRHVVAGYDWKRVAERVEGVYETIADERSPEAAAG